MRTKDDDALPPPKPRTGASRSRRALSADHSAFGGFDEERRVRKRASANARRWPLTIRGET